MFLKSFKRIRVFKKFKNIYIKFFEEELPHLKYPSISGYNSPRFYDPVFGQVNKFFSNHGARATYAPVGRNNEHPDLLKEKGYENAFEYNKSVWNHYRELFNNNYLEVKNRKKERLETLNRIKYPRYFDHSRFLIDKLFESKLAKEAYRRNTFQFEKLVLIILCGKYSDIGTVQNHPSCFPPITNSEFKERLEKIIPIYKNGIIPKSELPNVFVRELNILKKILLNIADHEHIINTINKFERIVFNDNGTGVSQIEIPCYTEFMSSNNDGESKQKTISNNFDQEEEDKIIENIGGRPRDFEEEDTEKWFNELSKKPEYQHSDGKPFINNIVLGVCRTKWL